MNKIVLLFTMLCVGALNGMEKLMWEIPKEIKLDIVSYLPNDNDLNVIVCAIKSTSLISIKWRNAINKAYGDQKKFTKLAHILANKFNKSTEAIATQFATSTSKQYIVLLNDLTATLSKNIFVKRKPLEDVIADGVDLNYTSDKNLPSLFLVIKEGAWPETLKRIKLLLEHGADIQLTHPKEGTVLEYAFHLFLYEHGCDGNEQSKIRDDILRFLVNTYYKGLNKDELKAIKKEYITERKLLSRQDRECLKKKIERDRAKRKAKLTKVS